MESRWVDESELTYRLASLAHGDTLACSCGCGYLLRFMRAQLFVFQTEDRLRHDLLRHRLGIKPVWEETGKK